MPYAPFKLRIYAFLLDYILIAAYGILVLGSLSFLFGSYFPSLFSNSPVTAQLTGFLVMTLPVSLYFILSEHSKWQGTWGKRKMGVRVVDASGRRIDMSRSIIRTAIKFLPWEVAHFCIWRLMLPADFSEMTLLIMLSAVNVSILIYFLTPFTNKKRKNVYDWISGTAVVK